jgi:hypothetical protein
MLVCEEIASYDILIRQAMYMSCKVKPFALNFSNALGTYILSRTSLAEKVNHLQFHKS